MKEGGLSSSASEALTPSLRTAFESSTSLLSSSSSTSSSSSSTSSSTIATVARILHSSLTNGATPYNASSCFRMTDCGNCLDIASCVWCSKKSECLNTNDVDNVCTKDEQTSTCPESLYTIIFISAVLFLLCVCCILCYFKKFRRMNNYVQSLIPSRLLTVPRSNRESIFKLGEGEYEWMCIICGFDNHPRCETCDMCGTDHQFSLDYKSGKKSEKEKTDGKRKEKLKAHDITLSVDTNNDFLGTELPIDAQMTQEHIANLTSGAISPMHSSSASYNEGTTDAAGGAKGIDAANNSVTKSSSYSFRNILSPMKRNEAINYRRLNQLSLRQKSARRRKMWQRVIDDSLGQFKWVRSSVTEVKIGNAPFGYTPQNSFNEEQFKESLADSYTNRDTFGSSNGGLASAAGGGSGSRSGSFSVIPGVTEYTPKHNRKNSKTSSHKSYDGGRSDSNDSFGDPVLLSNSPGFSSVFNQEGTLEWEKIQSGDISPRPSSTSLLGQKNINQKKIIKTTSDFLTRGNLPRRMSASTSGINIAGMNDISSSNIDSNIHGNINSNINSSSPMNYSNNSNSSNIDSPFGFGQPCMNRSTSNPNFVAYGNSERDSRGGGVGGGGGGGRGGDGGSDRIARNISSDGFGGVGGGLRAQSLTGDYTSPLSRRDLIAFTDPYSSFRPSMDVDGDTITTPLMSAFVGEHYDAEQRNIDQQILQDLQRKEMLKNSVIEATEEELRSFYYDLEAVAALTFRDKQLWFLDRMTDIQKPRVEGLIRLDVNRSNLLQDSVNTFGTIKPEDVHKWLRIQFINEPGIDAGGLEREWFELVTQALLEPSAGLFIRSSGNGLMGSYHINPCSAAINRDHLKYFKFAGLCFGKALMNQQPIAATLSLPLRKQILIMPVTFSDLEFVDAGMFQSLMWLKKNKNVESLCLDFSVCYEYFGNRMEYNLKPNGIDIPVTDDNKEEYLLLRLRHRLFDSIKAQLESFLAGFYQVIPPDILSVFDYQELDLLMCGVPDIDLEDWRSHTIYLNEYSRMGAKHKVIKWFWKAVEEMSREERVRLLQFVTGCSRLPAQGFRALQSSDGNFREFNIQSISKVDSKYPRSHTCFNKLDLPMYDSFAELESYLSIVITMDITGFSME